MWLIRALPSGDSEFVASVDLADLDRIRAYTADVARSIHHDDFAMWTELREIDLDMAARVAESAAETPVRR